MIVRTCLRAVPRPCIPSPRFLSSTSTSSLPTATPISAPQTAPQQGPPPSQPPPAATSTSAAQPFSASLTPSPSPSLAKDAAVVAAKKIAPLVKSSVPAGTPLKGLNFLKERADPVALADEEYPEWLWTILERQERKSEGGGMGDLFSKSKKQRRVAAKRLRKEQLAHPELLVPKVPIYEQTVDLPAGDAVESAAARAELTKALRGKRRADIKERNFLKAMG